MKAALLGGTGKLGLALAQRFHDKGHEVSIGSRDVGKALDAAKSIDQSLTQQYCSFRLTRQIK